MADKQKILVIGSNFHQDVKSILWSEINSVNIVDYDVVIIDTESLTEEFLKICKFDFFDKIRISLSRLLKSQGEIIALTGEKNHVKVSQHTTHSNHDWSPLRFGTPIESGDTVNIKEYRFFDYINRIKSWDFYYNVSAHYGMLLTNEFKDICGKPSEELKYQVFVEPLIENRYGKTLACSIAVSNFYKNKPNALFGNVTLLPFVKGTDSRERVNLILEKAFSLPQVTLPPVWTETLPMPVIPGLQSMIDEEIEIIKNSESKIVEYQNKIEALEKYKKLVYSGGSELEQIFAQCLEELGGKVTPAMYSDEEFVFEYKGQKYLVECKGVGKSISRANVNQLLGYITKYEEDEGHAGKGILLGNAWKELPINERDNNERVIFPDNVISAAERNEIALISSIDFFDIFCKFLNGEVAGEEILDKITATTGVTTFEYTDVRELDIAPAKVD